MFIENINYLAIKKLILLLMILFGLSQLNYSLAQNPIWSLPDFYFKIDSISVWNSTTLPSLLSPYTANHNAYPAPDGSLGFYVVDEYIYDGNGALIGAMWLPTAVELL